MDRNEGANKCTTILKSQSPDLHVTEMVWGNLNRVEHTKNLLNIYIWK